MGDLIERDKIYEAVYDLACKSVGVIGGISEDYAYGLREAANMIEEAQAVDAAPVVHGRWRQDDEDAWTCTACGNIWTFSDGGPNENNAKYCPVCGAKMRSYNDQ